MELRPPKPLGSNSQQSNALQREVADRYTQRWENRHKKERRAAFFATMRHFFSICFLCAIAGAGYYAWHTGLLDKWTGKEPSPEPAIETSGFGSNDPVKASEGAKAAYTPDNTAKKTSADHKQNADALAKAEESFRQAKLDYWKNAPDSDRPEKARTPLTFRCLAPDEKGNPVFLELATTPGSGMKVRRLSASAGLVDIPAKEFSRLTAKEPYIVMRERRAYFASSRKNDGKDTYPVPEKENFNASRMVFGKLYNVFAAIRMPPPPFLYAVQFMPKGDSNPINIAKVGYGESIARETFTKKVAERYNLDIASDAKAIDAVLRLGRIRITEL